MTNKASVWCTVMGILGYLVGVGLCFTLIFIPVAVYCFIGARKYIEWSNMTDSQLATYKTNLTNWAIFFSIVAFPIGLLSIVPAALVSNNVTITNVEEPSEQKKEATTETTQQEQPKDLAENTISTIEKLDKLKEEGLITEEEYARAKSDLLNKSNN